MGLAPHERLARFPLGAHELGHSCRMGGGAWRADLDKEEAGTIAMVKSWGFALPTALYPESRAAFVQWKCEVLRANPQAWRASESMICKSTRHVPSTWPGVFRAVDGEIFTPNTKQRQRLALVRRDV